MNKKIFMVLAFSTPYIQSGFARMHPEKFNRSSSSSYDDYSNSSSYSSGSSYNSSDTTYSNNNYSYNYDDDQDSTNSYSKDTPTNYSSSTSTSLSKSIKDVSKASATIQTITVSISAPSDSSYYRGESISLTFQDKFSIADLRNGLELSITVFPKSTPSKQTLYNKESSYLTVAVLKTLDGKIIAKRSQSAAFTKIPTTINVEYGDKLLTSKTFFTQNTGISDTQNLQLFNIQSPITTTMSIKNFNGILVVS